MLELPAVQRFWEDAEVQGVHLVTIVPADDADKARRTVSKLGYSFPVLIDAGSRVAAAYRIAGVSQIETHVVSSPENHRAQRR